MPQKLMAKLTKKEQLSKTYFLFTFEFEADYPFLPGQFVSALVAPDGTRRSYSIASAPKRNLIELLIDTSPMGVGCRFFLALAVGDEVEMLGPVGIFVFDTKQPKEKKMFVATGSGIAPMRSMITDLLTNQKYQDNLRLIWGMRYEEDLFWQGEWESLRQKYPNFGYEVVLSKATDKWRGCQGHIGDCLRDHFTSSERDISKWEFYLCGGQGMIAETAAYLQTLAVAKENIHFEKFF